MAKIFMTLIFICFIGLSVGLRCPVCDGNDRNCDSLTPTDCVECDSYACIKGVLKSK